jgi:outer membrane lipoprotein carrier protein
MVAVKSLYRIAISLICLASAVVVAAAEEQGPAITLQERLLATDGIVANFTQQVTNAQGYVVEQASGTLHVAKPRFRWEVLDPFPQIILANGDQLEIYDPDLEQVTTKTMEGALDQAPLALLTQTELDLSAHFEVELQDHENQRFILWPRSVDALFERVELVFRGDKLLTLLIHDHSGQQTVIRFTQYRAGQVIQSEVFELEYPPGTDIVRG